MGEGHRHSIFNSCIFIVPTSFPGDQVDRVPHTVVLKSISPHPLVLYFKKGPSFPVSSSWLFLIKITVNFSQLQSHPESLCVVEKERLHPVTNDYVLRTDGNAETAITLTWHSNKHLKSVNGELACVRVCVLACMCAWPCMHLRFQL